MSAYNDLEGLLLVVLVTASIGMGALLGYAFAQKKTYQACETLQHIKIEMGGVNHTYVCVKVPR